MASESLRDTRPVAINADAVVLLQKKRTKRTTSAVIVEVQLRVDHAKPAAWLAYLALLHRELKTPVTLLVIAPSKRIARWCSRPLQYGHPGLVLRPCVVGPGVIPKVSDLAAVAAAPELAVLSSIAFANDRDAVARTDVVLRGLAGADVDARLRAVYSDVVIAALPAAALAALEELMAQKYEYQSDMAKRWFAEGRAEGAAEVLSAVLVSRGFAIPHELEARIRGCRDNALLARWASRAATAERIEAVFDDS